MVTDGRWWIDVDDRPGDEWVNAARLAIADGWLGSQAMGETSSKPADGRTAPGTVRINGVYGAEPPGELLSLPAWTPRDWMGRGLRWRLDLRRGVLDHCLLFGGYETATQRWAQVDEPGTQVHHAPAAPSPDEATGAEPTVSLLEGVDGRVGVLAAAQRRIGDGVLRVAVARCGDDRRAVERAACEIRDRVLADGPDRLRARQQRGWSRRWADAGVSIGGDPLSEVRTRYALHHLLSLAACPPDLALGARGLTGSGYLGHVFWDTDVFVLPAMASIAPEAAAAMVAYRLRRLDAAREAAAADGLTGARFPWESAATGRDVTPRSAIGPRGEPVEIATGDRELHISADVCWAILQLVRWTGRDALLAGAGGEAIAEVARWWASRVEIGGDGRGHLRHVIGPDEYHDDVDDNAFTNQMARWTLRLAAGLAGDYGGAAGSTAAEWRRVADALVDGYRPDLGRHEQFAAMTPSIRSGPRRSPRFPSLPTCCWVSAGCSDHSSSSRRTF